MLSNKLAKTFHGNNYIDVFRRGSVRAFSKNVGDLEEALRIAKPYTSIPKVPMLPGLGSTWAYFPVIGRYSTKQLHKADILKNRTYGDIVRERFGTTEFVTCYTPEAMSVIMEHEGSFPVRSEFATLKAYREKRKEWYQPLGTLTMQGEEWYKLRSKVEDYLMGDGFRWYVPQLQEISDEFATLMRLKRRDKMEVYDVTSYLYKWALECIFLVALDARLDCLNPHLDSNSDGMKMIEAMHVQLDCCNEMEDVVGNFPFWKYFPTPMWFKFTKAADAFTATAMKYIAGSIDRQLSNPESMKSKTLLHKLLVTEKVDISTAMVIIADLMMGGIDTTSHTAAFLMYNLATNPLKQQKAYEEIVKVMPNKEPLTDDLCSELKYISCCLKESMRLYPTIRGNMRIFDHDVVISGYRIPAGTAVLCALQVINRNEQYFKNANAFLPERWLLNTEDTNMPTYQPFGYGKRSCPGRTLAEREILCLVTMLLRNFELDYDQVHPALDMYTRIVNAPDKPLRLQFGNRYANKPSYMI